MTDVKDDNKSRLPQTDIDKIIHEPARLKILAQLYVVENADVIFLIQRTGLTQGNLSTHMSKLEAAEYIEIRKEFVNKKPHTLLSLSDKGRSAFRSYIKNMKEAFEELIDW